MADILYIYLYLYLFHVKSEGLGGQVFYEIIHDSDQILQVFETIAGRVRVYTLFSARSNSWRVDSWNKQGRQIFTAKKTDRKSTIQHKLKQQNKN